MLSQSQKEVTIFTKHKAPQNITFVLDDIIFEDGVQNYISQQSYGLSELKIHSWIA